ncbi:hypothetical protein RJT34_18498 [Clitoria ternatea]|uniref:F-box domain-containing protein n=1 Tax=Clitoria ternatea TaxID=43366 RepID=A0AAN9JD55_CLITE
MCRPAMQGRARKRSTMNEKNQRKKRVTPFLPDELIESILLRLPVRSLLRFKSVCKSWLSLISNPQFAESHFDLAASPTNRHLLWSWAAANPFVSIDKDASPDDDSAIVTLLPPHPSCVLGSCRGFLLLHHQRADFDLIVWNPSTGAHKSIPRPVQCDFDVTGMSPFLCGFGYDPSTNDYLIILVPFGKNRFQTYSFKTNLWNATDHNYFPLRPIGCYSFFLFINDAFYWLTSYKHDPVILVFDLV